MWLTLYYDILVFCWNFSIKKLHFCPQEVKIAWSNLPIGLKYNLLMEKMHQNLRISQSQIQKFRNNASDVIYLVLLFIFFHRNDITSNCGFNYAWCNKLVSLIEKRYLAIIASNKIIFLGCVLTVTYSYNHGYIF